MHRLLIIWLFITSCFWLAAQNPHPHFRNYTTDDGLPSPEVHYTIQDTMGYMWFATDNGLSRFDGYEFKNYGSQEGLKHHVVFYMQKAPNGRIWLCTMHGHLYYIDGDTIRPFSQNAAIEQLNPNLEIVIDFYIDKDGIKYLCIQGLGILKLDDKTIAQLIKGSQTFTESFILPFPDRFIYGVTRSDIIREKLRQQNILPGDIQPVEILLNPPNYLEHISLYDKIKGAGAWAHPIGPNQQILRYASGHFIKMNGNQIDWIFDYDSEVQQKGFVQDHENRWLMSCLRGGGLRRYNSIDDIPLKQYEQFLNGKSISHVFKDLKGGYWISTLENGVYYTSDLNLKIYDESFGLPENFVSSFDFINDSLMYVGLRHGAMFILNHYNNTITKTPELKKNSIIYDMLYDSKRKELWITNARPNLLRRNKWKTDFFIDKNPTILGLKMTVSRDSNFLYGTSPFGFGKIDLDNHDKVLSSSSHDIHLRTLKIWEDQTHRIWVGNVNGLFEFKNNQLYSPQPFHKLFKTRVEDISELSDGTLVIATKGEGLLFWNENFIHQLTTKDGLTADMLENIYVDSKDQIWVGTLTGLSKIIRKNDNFEIKNYTTFHGLPSNEITKIKAYNEQLWIGTSKGLVKWKEKEKTEFSPSPIFESTLINNQTFDFYKNSSLPHDKNNLEFRFSTFNYNNNGKILYRFRLNQEDWKTTRNRSVNFTDLPAGEYQFDVQSQNEDGLWSDSNSLNFDIQPAFWQTWWFTLLGVIVLLGIIVWNYKNRIRRIKKETQVEKEILELQNTALKAQMNPHFIFNCLNSIQNFIAKNDQKNATLYLAQFAQLIRGALNASMEEEISLQDEVTLLENYLNLEKLRFKEQFDYTIHVDEKLDKFETTLPPLLSQPFVENAIIHGFAKTNTGGKLNIEFLKRNEKLEIIIRDNGQGILQSQKNTTLSSPIHNGVGMSISKKRLALADKLNEYDAQEIKDENGMVMGTAVRLVLEI